MAPTGTFTIMENGQPIAGPFDLDENGKAFPTDNTTSLLAPGVHKLVNHYSGDSLYPAADSPEYDLTINPPKVAVSIATSNNPVAYGQPIMWSLAVTPQ